MKLDYSNLTIAFFKFEITLIWLILELEYKLKHQNNLNKFDESEYDIKKVRSYTRIIKVKKKFCFACAEYTS